MSVEGETVEATEQPQAAVEQSAPAESAPVTETPAPAQPAVAQPTETQAPDRSHEFAGLIKALQDERDQKKAFRDEAHRLRALHEDAARKREEAAKQRPHVLEDPEGYDAWWENRVSSLERGFETKLSQTLTRERIESSTEKWSEKLGDEEFNKLRDWSATMPPQWVKWAEGQRDPFGVAHKEFTKQQQAKQAEALARELGGKALSDFLEEKKQAWMAEQAAAAPVDGSPVSDRERDAQGKFIPTTQPQRHQPASLATINGAPAPRGVEARSGYDALIKRG